ncbi:MAG: hypothetical protein HOC91_15665 [Nitrospinaceae bacterium]|nr:hypothetical protein [Nitrospinaceae bacterium]MBT3432398.1 hypothetical protein [Nitrospinaceae bacterium]MBT3820896.1 hypothetical protein [Nitrospinaceae bacterium]MBT4092508.1 hypothetical protein [Nitrospinaceae bacterium]MBT4431946.1 hypothetical protein [Nitrospinaceae bacterium]
MTDEPILTTDQKFAPGERPIDKPELRPGGTLTRQWAETEWSGDGQIKVGRKDKFEVFCDEPPRIGGKDRYPQPLTYICMGVGF